MKLIRHQLQSLLAVRPLERVYAGLTSGDPPKRVLVRQLLPGLPNEEFAETARVFESHMERLAELQLPGALPVREYAADPGGQLYFVTDVPSGLTLGELIAETGSLSVPTAAALGIRIGRCLEHAHEHQVYHLALHRNQVLVSAGPEVFLLDLGLVPLLLERVDQRLRHVSAAWEHLFPEPGAVAPEHIAQGSLGPHTDVYGLGVLLYLMTTTALPFGGSAVVAYNTIVAGNHSPNPRSEMGDLSEEFAGLVERCLARVPADRPSSMAQVIQELQAFVPNQEVALSQIAPVLHGQSYLERFEPLLRLVDGGSDNEEETAIGPPPSSAVIPLFEADWNQEFVSDAELLARMTPEQRRVYMRDIYGDEIPSGSNKGVYWGLIVAAIILSFALSWMTATPHQESVTESSINWSTEMAPLERRPPEETTERRKRKAIILYR